MIKFGKDNHYFRFGNANVTIFYSNIEKNIIQPTNIKSEVTYRQPRSYHKLYA